MVVSDSGFLGSGRESAHRSATSCSVSISCYLVYGWTGNHVGLSELSSADVRRLRRERPPVVEELRRDSITLAGRASTEILGATK